MDLITPEFGLVFWTLITFFILLVILKKFAWKPILGAVSEREEGIKNALASAENARIEMENLQSDNERILKEARLERELKNKIIDDAKEEAKRQSDKLVRQAQETILREKKAAISDLKAEVAKVSISIAEKVIRGELSDADKQEKLVKSMLDDNSLN